MLLKDIIADGYIALQGDIEGIEAMHLTLDSRTCRKGSLYFAISGTRCDGHTFIESAFQNGAVAAVVERFTDCPVPQILVENSRRAMALFAAVFYGRPAERLKMIGITGTNGKTTVSYMIKAIAVRCGISCGVIGTSGIYLNDTKMDIAIATSTTPDPIELHAVLKQMADGGAQWVVMEVTAHALDLHKIDGICFESAGFTNLTQDHLDYFITMEKYAGAKRKFFNKESTKCGIINMDDAFGREIYRDANIPCCGYSAAVPADITASEIVIGPAQSVFWLEAEGRRLWMQTHTTGLFNISNVLCAVGCAHAAGVSLEACAEGIACFISVPGRFEAVDTGERGVSVIIDYAHTPDGLENVLSSINAFKKGRLICVFGCGGDRDATKRPIMGQLAGEKSDYCIITSDNPRFEEPEAIIDQVEAGIKKTVCPYVRNADRRAAIELALHYAQKGDIIAICGKGDEDYQDIKGQKHHFSDRETVEELIGL